MRGLANMLVKELVQLRRDPKILPILFVAPVMQLLVLGYAATTDIHDVELAVCDLDRSTVSRQFVDRFVCSRSFVRASTATDQRELAEALGAGEAKIALTIPAGFSADLRSGRGAETQILADGSDSMSGTLAVGYATGVIQHAAASSGRTPAVDLKPKVLYNPDLISRNYMVPGVLATIIMIMTMLLSSMAIVRETEIGTMEQLLVTPLPPSLLIVGKLVPFALVGIVEISTALPVVLFWFDVPLRGSLVTLAALTLPFMLCTLGLGLLVSTLARTQQQAMMIATFVFMLPQIYLSGFVFPIQNMPTVFQWITYAIPLRYYVVVIRGVFLKGVGFEVLWPQGAAMVGLGLAILLLARMRFRRQLG